MNPGKLFSNVPNYYLIINYCYVYKHVKVNEIEQQVLFTCNNRTLSLKKIDYLVEHSILTIIVSTMYSRHDS